jgi:hypothetical protein
MKTSLRIIIFAVVTLILAITGLELIHLFSRDIGLSGVAYSPIIIVISIVGGFLTSLIMGYKGLNIVLKVMICLVLITGLLVVDILLVTSSGRGG